VQPIHEVTERFGPQQGLEQTHAAVLIDVDDPRVQTLVGDFEVALRLVEALLVGADIALDIGQLDLGVLVVLTRRLESIVQRLDLFTEVLGLDLGLRDRSRIGSRVRGRNE
jgi:hypothetical protein